VHANGQLCSKLNLMPWGCLMAFHSENSDLVSDVGSFSQTFVVFHVPWFFLSNVLEALKSELFAVTYKIKHSPDFTVLFAWLYSSYVIWKASDPHWGFYLFLFIYLLFLFFYFSGGVGCILIFTVQLCAEANVLTLVKQNNFVIKVQRKFHH